MKKMQKILCMLLALAMLLSFAACAAKEAAPSTTDTPAADAADEKTETKAEDTPAEQPAAELPELTLMLQTSDESNGLLAAVDYVNAHAEEIGAKLILEKVPDGDQGEQVIQVRYAGGEDVPDILYFQPVSYTNSRLSVADNFVDLTANDYSYLYSDSYLRTPGYLLDGKLYNLPIATGGGMYMFYNKDVLAASGITEVPTTWDAFLADCEAIKANGISPVYYSGVDTWTLQFFALMGWYSDYAPEDAQAFADAMSTNQKHWSDMNGFIDSIGKIKELVDLGYVQEPSLSDTYQQAQQALLDGTCAFYAQGAEVASFDDPAFREVMTFMQEKVLQKIDSANFGPGGDDDEQYRNDFFDGKTAMLFNGVWDAGGSVDCAAGAENIKPANFPTNESGKRASLMSGGTGFVVSNSLTDAQTAACIEFIKYMTSEEIANKIIAFGIGMAPNTNVDYATLMDSVDAPEAKLLVSACQLCMAADYQALGLGNEFGDFEGEIQAKYAGLKDGSKTVDDVVSELDAVIAAN